MSEPKQKIDCSILERGKFSAEVRFTDPAKKFSANNFAGFYFSSYPDFIIPLNEVPSLVRYVLEKLIDWNVVIDPSLREYAEREIQRERAILEIASAKDAPEIENGLLLPYKPLQRAAIQFHEYLNYSKINSLVTGAGKTVVAIGMIEREQYRALIILPAKAINTWKSAILKFTGKTAVELSGRVPDIRMIQAMMDPRNQYFLLPYEVIGTEHTEDENTDENDETVKSRPWVIALNLMIANNHLQFFVADEAHQFGNLDTKRAKSILALNISAGRSLPMTATPIVNNGKDLYPLLKFCDAQSFPNPKGFLDAYYTENGKYVKDEKKLQKLLSVYMFRRNFDDLYGADRPIITREKVPVEIVGFHRQRIKSLEQGIFLSRNMDDSKILTDILPKLNAYRQVVGEAKIESSIALAKELIESGEKVLLFCWFKDMVELAAKKLGCRFIHGDVPMGLRTQYENEFQNDPSVRCMVLSVKTSQEILTLTQASHIICNDICWTAKDHTQMEGRCFLRTNDPHGGTTSLMVTDSMIDQLMTEIIAYKMNLSDTAVDGSKEYAEVGVSIVRELISRLRGFSGTVSSTTEFSKLFH